MGYKRKSMRQSIVGYKRKSMRQSIGGRPPVPNPAAAEPMAGRVAAQLNSTCTTVHTDHAELTSARRAVLQARRTHPLRPASSDATRGRCGLAYVESLRAVLQPCLLHLVTLPCVCRCAAARGARQQEKATHTTAMSAPRSKFVIQPFKHNQQMDEEYANRTWQTLHDAIREIHRQNASGLSFEELYRNAYNMVLHKFGDKLYNGLSDTITRHLQAIAAQVADANDELFLPELKDKWDKHKLSSIMIRDILMYMVGASGSDTASADRQRVPPATTRPVMQSPRVAPAAADRLLCKRPTLACIVWIERRTAHTSPLKRRRPFTSGGCRSSAMRCAATRASRTGCCT